MTDQTGGFASDEPGTDVIDTVVDIRNLVGVTGGTGHTGAGCDCSLNINQRCGCCAGIVMTAGTVRVLGDDIAEGCQVTEAVIMTDCTTLLGGLRCIDGRIVADVVSVAMVVKTSGVTGQTITCA